MSNEVIDEQLEKEGLDFAMQTIKESGLLSMPNDAKAYAVEAMMLVSYQMMRQISGDEFVLGWLESAVADVKTPRVVEFKFDKAH